MGWEFLENPWTGIEHWFGRWHLIGGDIATMVDGRWYRYSAGRWFPQP